MKNPVVSYLFALLTPRYSFTAIKVAVLVGMILFVINHSVDFFDGAMNTRRWISAGLTFLVPYAVSVHGQWMSVRRAEAKAAAALSEAS